MRNSDLKFNSALMPQGFCRDWDMHIYFTLENRHKAVELQSRALKELADPVYFVGPLFDIAIGPHPLPSFEINFAADRFLESLAWMMKNRGDLTVLIHQVTGDDPWDHSQGAVWLGPPVVLDESKLDPSPVRKTEALA
jgi:aromatic ring-cleaving dioxygenase